MVGLVFAETLRLTPVQWAAVGLNAAGWLWCYRETRNAGPRSAFPLQGGVRGGFFRQWGITALLTFSGLWWTFWNQPTSIDQQMLFEQAHYLSRFAWPEMLNEFADQPYVQYQPPFLTFWFARMPVFWRHQLVMLPFGLLCAGLMLRLYGRHAALLLATPVFALMIHQPCSDTVLFGLLLITQRFCQMEKHAAKNAKEREEEELLPQRRKGVMFFSLRLRAFAVGIFLRGHSRLMAAFVYGLTWPVKPLTLLTAPFMLPRLGWTGLLSLVMWTGYVIWSLRWPFGRRQAAFLLHQLIIRSMQRRPSGPPPPPRPPRPVWFWLWQTVCWRWDHLGRQAVRALPLYIFPAYLRPWRWAGIALASIIVFGYGNLKYLLVMLVEVFPVLTEEE